MCPFWDCLPVVILVLFWLLQQCRSITTAMFRKAEETVNVEGQWARMVLRLRARAHGTFVACSCGYCNGHLCATCRSRTPAFQPRSSGCCRANRWWKTRPFLETMRNWPSSMEPATRRTSRRPHGFATGWEFVLASSRTPRWRACLPQGLQRGCHQGGQDPGPKGRWQAGPGRPPNAEGRPAEARCATAHRCAGERHR